MKKLIERLFGAEPGPAPTPPEPTAAPAEFIVPPRPYVNQQALETAGARIGMWVVHDGQLGILTGCGADGVATVTLQKADGTTLMELDASDNAVPATRHADLSSLRAAYIEEVPASRHEGEAHLREFGYIGQEEAA
jgi:hypothetical protein